MGLLEIWNKLQIQKKCAIITTFLFGLLAHGPIMFKKLAKQDDILYMFIGGETFSSGRWMLFAAEKLKNLLFQDSVYNIPTFNVVFSLCCIAVAACIIIDLFDIKLINLCILLSGIMVCIPVMASMYAYMFTAQFFSLAILFAVAGSSLVLTKKQWYWILLGIFLMTLSVGIYQAYIPLMLCIFLFGMIKQFSEADTREKQKRAFFRIMILGISCVGFLLLNTVILNICLKITDIKLSGYKGIGYATKTPLMIYLSRAVFAYKEFLLPQKGTFYDILPGSSHALYLCVHLLTVIFYACFLFSVWKKSKLSGIMILLMGLMVPLVVNFIFVMVDETYCYVLMEYGYVMYFVFFIWIFENVQEQFRSVIKKISGGIVSCILFLFVIIFCRFDNLCYMKLEITQAQMTRYFTTLVTRMQDADGYDASMPVAYIGKPRISENDTTITEIQELNHIHVSPFFGFRESLPHEHWRQLMNVFLAFKAWEVDPAELETLPEVQAMPSYPNKGSIKVIDDTLVVKF